MTLSARPTPEEVALVKTQGHRPGWLRSRFMHQSWPRPGVAPCGRPVCAAIAQQPIETSDVKASRRNWR